MTGLEARTIRVSFGAVQACRDVDLDAASGVITGLIGPNGSGKSTLLNALTGVVAASGTVRVGDQEVALADPGGARRAGILRTHQTPHNYSELSCLDNACLAMLDPAGRTLLSALVRRRHGARHEQSRWTQGAAALERVGLLHLAEAPAAALTYGQARLLELARSLAGNPAVLLMDEPSAGLNAAETENLADLLESVRADGITMVLVDHKVDFVDRLCERIVVLDQGAVIAAGSPAEVWSDRRVVDAYLGVADVG